MSVVIPCKGHAAELTECLRSLLREDTGVDVEIIVVDSAADAGVQAAVKQFVGVKIVSSTTDLNAGAARNLGAQQAQADILAFIDADCKAEPQWLPALYEGFSQNKKLLGGPILNFSPTTAICMADNLLQFSDFGVARADGNAEHFPSCNMAIKRADFFELGGFPATAGEDVIFCLKAQARWPDGLYFINAMRVRHHGRERLAQFWRHQEAFGFVRASKKLLLTPMQLSLGKSALALPAVVVKRLNYIFWRVVTGHRLGFAKTCMLLPLMVFGLTAWAVGFRRGCLNAFDAEHVAEIT